MATIFDSHFAKQNTNFAPLKPTQREVETFGQALKSPEFRAMLCDYVQEVSDPQNREKYVEEMTQLEAARGNHVTFLIPQPGYVMKTRVLSSPKSSKDELEIDEMGKGKVFVNVCSDEHVEDAKEVPEKRDSVTGSCLFIQFLTACNCSSGKRINFNGNVSESNCKLFLLNITNVCT